MYFFRKISQITLFYLLTLSRLFSADGVEFDSKQNNIPVRVQLFNLASNDIDSSRLVVAASVSQEKIQFIKRNEHYQAEIIFSVQLVDEDENTLVVRDFSQKIMLSDFTETVQAATRDYFLGSYDLKPGKYTLYVKVFDLYSKLEGFYSRELTLKDFGKRKIQSSHLMFVSKRKFNLTTLENVLLNFSGKVPDSFFVYIEFVTQKPGSRVKVEYQLKDLEENILQKHSGSIKLDRWKQAVFLPLHTDKLSIGRNQVVIDFSYDGEKFSTSHFIYLSWGVVSDAPQITRITLPQLRVIAKGGDIKKIQNAPPEERDRLIAEYWKERDPTPGTDENELFDEFLRRIREANQRFSFSRDDGWNTDRGRVYLKYGPPDIIERDIPARNSFGRYEIWTYEILKQQFVFYDRNGTGLYRLVSY